jgi:hypothetical protein
LTSETPVHSLLPFKDLREKLKRKGRKYITQKAKDKRRPWLLACFDSTLAPNIRDPSKAHQNLLQEQETLKKTHSLSTMYCA